MKKKLIMKDPTDINMLRGYYEQIIANSSTIQMNGQIP